MIRLALAFVTFLSLAHPLHAEGAYPQTTIRIVLGFSPGSAPDVAARRCRILWPRGQSAAGRGADHQWIGP